MPVSYGKGAKKKAIKLHSVLVRQRGVCQRCGKCFSDLAMFDAAHVHSRRYARTVTLLDNAWCLCRSCHRRVDTFPDEKMQLVYKTIGESRYYELKAIAEDTRSQKVDWAAEYARLQEVERQAA